MKLEANITRFAPSNGFICEVDKHRKATEEDYDFRFISPGYYLCSHEGNAYAISDYKGKIGCACADMTFNCKGKEVCKHLEKFMRLKDLPSNPVDEEMIQLLEAAGWAGQKLTPPDRPGNRKKKRLPNIHDPDRKPVPQATQREKCKKSYDGKSAEEIVQAMDGKELERNARKGGVMAIKELARREAERAVSA